MPHPDDYDDHGDDRYDDRRRDDEHDRRGDDGYDDYEQPQGDNRSARVRRARERVSLPAIFLLIFGLFCLAFNVMAAVLYLITPDTLAKPKYDLIKENLPQQPLPAYEDFVKQEQSQQSVMYSIRTIASILVVVGAVKMRALQTYGLAMTSAILSIVPLCVNECCCMLPFGIWALVVLLNGEVKQGFSIVARGGSHG
jgi:hypothetical protein